MTDETIAEEAPAKRKRPTKEELDARELELAERADELALQERQVQLDAAEANLAMRAVEVERAKMAGVASARSGGVRNEEIRSDTISEGPIRGRRYKGTDMPNKFHVPVEDIPVGTSYQWNNYSVFGKGDPAYDSFMEMQGWTPVPADRHPHLVPRDHKGPIVVDGQILVERPQALTNEALQEELDKARGEVRMKEEQLYGTPQGTLPRARANGSNEFIAVQKTVEPGAPIKPTYKYEGTGLPIE